MLKMAVSMEVGTSFQQHLLVALAPSNVAYAVNECCSLTVTMKIV